MITDPPRRPGATRRVEAGEQPHGKEVSLRVAEEKRVRAEWGVIAVMTTIQLLVGAGLTAASGYMLWLLTVALLG